MQTSRDDEFLLGFEFSCVQIKKRFSRTFLMEFLDIRRRDV